MKVCDIEGAKAGLENLVELAQQGETFLIARDGKPIVKVTGLPRISTASALNRIGFMEGQFNVPDDFDTMFQKEIEEMFYGSSPPDFKEGV